jgi:hypothetical protein
LCRSALARDRGCRKHPSRASALLQVGPVHRRRRGRTSLRRRKPLETCIRERE